MKSELEIGIIGAGPAGVFAALSVKETNENTEVTVFDWQEPLTTLLPTGGGRCNFSYFETDIKTFASYYPRGSKFILSALTRFSMNDTVDYFEKIGIKSYVQSDNRIFPISDSAKKTAEKLLARGNKLGVKFIQQRVSHIFHDGENFIISTYEKDYRFKKLILATGGKNFKLARALKHKIITPALTLAPLEIAEKEYYELSGLTLKDVWVKVYYDNKKLLNLAGNILFTKNSISGPLIFKISSCCVYEKYTSENPLELQINLAGQNYTYIDNFIKDFRINSPKTTIKNSFGAFCPKNLFEKILKKEEIDGTKQISQMTNKEKEIILENLTEFKLHVTGKVIGTGIVTAGGVDTDEINPTTMESKIISGLFFAGEMINVDGFTGGFNLQNCWSTAHLAAISLLQEKK